MKSSKVIAVTMVAIAALWIAGPASAGGKGGHAAASGHRAANATRASGARNMAWARSRNRRFVNSSQFLPYGGYYGNAVYLNSDEADWGEQWTSLYEDNDGPYARSTRENPEGRARMWEFPEK